MDEIKERRGGMGLIWFKAIRLHPLSLILLSLVVLLGVVGVREGLSARGEAAVEAWSWAVANRIIVIDPGHGGIDPGAVSPSGTLEKDITLQVAMRLNRLLSEAGAVTILTRETDSDLASMEGGSLLERKRRDLAQRVALANQHQADFYISIHVNSFPSSRWWGAQTFYSRRSESGRKLAESIQAELIRVLGNNRRQAKGEDYYVLEKTQVTAVNVEIGFMSNPNEERLLKDPVYQEKIAQAIYAGVVRYCVQEPAR